jgi:hypothetical protein
MSGAMAALERLQAKRKQTDNHRANYQATLSKFKQLYEWTDTDCREYSDSVRVIMNGSDDEVMALYPQGVFANADDARQSAREFWQHNAGNRVK